MRTPPITSHEPPVTSTDVFTVEQRSAVMRRVKGRDTTPEMKARRVLRASGIGYQLGGCGLPGKPDLVMRGRRVVVFVHGCFWHGHDCRRGARQPKANADYWLAKIDRNRTRDSRVQHDLRQAGWRVIILWECGLTGDWGDRFVAEVRAQENNQATASA